MKTKIKKYTALTDFRSVGMNKSFCQGEEIHAPAAIGLQWVRKGYAKEITKPKSTQS